MAPEGIYVEIGTSAGYSTLWLGLACLQLGRRIKTYEILPDKVRMAEETFAMTGFDGFIELIEGDARDYLANEEGIAFCFLDAEKEMQGTAMIWWCREWSPAVFLSPTTRLTMKPP